MADRIADITALADRAAAEGSAVVSLQALFDTLGQPQPHYLHIRADGWNITHGYALDQRTPPGMTPRGACCILCGRVTARRDDQGMPWCGGGLPTETKEHQTT